jgi:transcriptional regulator with XRE-family HTH domain
LALRCLAFLVWNCRPPDLGKETLGQRITRIRKERGFTQIELAQRIGTIQTLVCDHENDRLRLSGEMAFRFALALEISVDELLRGKSSKTVSRQPSRKALRRLEQIESLPGTQQSVVLKTIDTFLGNAALKSARRA